MEPEFNENTSNDHIISFLSKDGIYIDNYLNGVTLPIVSRLITHEIGNGTDDGLLHSAILELIPRDEMLATNNYIATSDPMFETELRNRTYKNQLPIHPRGWFDLVAHNWPNKNRGALNPFTSLMQGTLNLDMNDMISSREGLMLLAPMHTKYRRSRFRLVTSMGVVLKSIFINVMEDIRRRQ
jgi:hypothetical protein